MPKFSMLATITMRPTSSVVLQFMRYIVVGGLATVVDVSIFMFCYRLAGMNLIVANTMGFIGGIVVNYVLSTIWVFDRRNCRSRKVEILVFSAIGIGGLAISHILLYTSVEMFSLFDLYGKVIAVTGSLVWNFGIRKLLLFRELPEPHDNIVCGAKTKKVSHE